MTISLVMISAAAPPGAMFAGGGEAVEITGGTARKLLRLGETLGRPGAVWAAPSARALATAEALGLRPGPAEALRDCDFGAWAGLPVEEVQRRAPEPFAAWLRNPESAPHGGESLAAVQVRVADWLDHLGGARHVLAVADALVVRAAAGHALGLGAAVHRRVDVRPAEAVRLSGEGARWRLVASATAL